MIGLTKAAAKELGPSGVRVNAIMPGLIRTAMTLAMKPEIYQARERDVPLQRAGTPDEVAGAAVFLASPLASYVNGAVIEVTGGRGYEHPGKSAMKEAVICEPLRTPVGRYGGVFKDVPAAELAETVLRELVRRTGIDGGRHRRRDLRPVLSERRGAGDRPRRRARRRPRRAACRACRSTGAAARACRR